MDTGGVVTVLKKRLCYLMSDSPSAGHNSGVFNTIRRALSFALLPRAAWRLAKDAAQEAKGLARATAEELRKTNDHRQLHATWTSAVIAYRLTEARVRRIVRKQQLIAAIAMIFFGVGVYGWAVWSALLPGVGCTFIAAIYYVQAALRLHQMRHREFCSLPVYFTRVASEPREFLPRGLPPGWALLGQ
jgi:hypothetical protein